MIQIIGVLLAIMAGSGGLGYYFYSSLKVSYDISLINNIKLEQAVATSEGALGQLQADVNMQVDAILTQYIQLEERYAVTQKKREELLRGLDENKTLFKESTSSSDLTTIINDGSNVLLNRIEELTSNYYSIRKAKSSEGITKKPTEASAFNNEEDNVEGLF